MAQVEEYDVLILGSGAPGKLRGWILASHGRQTAVVERRYIGGSCLNIACSPRKNVIHGAKVAHYFRPAAAFGIAHGDWKIDMAAVSASASKSIS
jgi:pyruvate/2-oxoglutarate dehydrogenase complex dihydrolipoamide dehydrogenase (E3) component